MLKHTPAPWKIEDDKIEEIKKVVLAYPEKCLITGFKRCDNYYFEEGVVYLPSPAYDAYTLPEYDSAEKAFYSTVIDMDDDFRREKTLIADLENLIDKDNFQEIKEFYQIPDDDIKFFKY